MKIKKKSNPVSRTQGKMGAFSSPRPEGIFTTRLYSIAPLCVYEGILGRFRLDAARDRTLDPAIENKYSKFETTSAQYTRRYKMNIRRKDDESFAASSYIGRRDPTYVHSLTTIAPKYF